jgi:hypothetical protein
LLLSFTDNNEASAGTWNSTSNKEKILLWTNTNYLKILNSYAIPTHATWHALILEDTSWELTTSDSSNVSSNFVSTTSHRLTLHVVTTNYSLESSADRNA